MTGLMVCGCGRAIPTQPVPVASFEQLMESPGGPSIITETTAGKLVELLEPKYKELDPASVIVHGDSVATDGVTTRGVRVVLIANASSANDRKASNVANFYMEETEVHACSAAVKTEIAFADTESKNPPQAQKDIRWASKDGMVMFSGFSDGQPSYSISTKRAGGPILGLQKDQFAKFGELLDAALNSTRSN